MELWSIKSAALIIAGTLGFFQVSGNFFGFLYSIQCGMPDNYHVDCQGDIFNTHPIGAHDIRFDYAVSVGGEWIASGQIYVGEIPPQRGVHVQQRIPLSRYVDASRELPVVHGTLRGYMGPIPFIIPVNQDIVEIFIENVR